MQERLAIPYAPTPWSKDDVGKIVELMIAAFPIKVILHDNMEKEDLEWTGFEVLHTIELVYSRKCRELHALAEAPAANEEALEKLKAFVRDDLSACRQEYKSAEQLVGGKRGSSKANDKGIEIPTSVTSNDHVTKVLASFA